jgi:hypothetical protein
MMRAVLWRSKRRARSTRKPDERDTSRTLPSSEGCRLNSGVSIHAFAPRW